MSFKEFDIFCKGCVPLTSVVDDVAIKITVKPRKNLNSKANKNLKYCNRFMCVHHGVRILSLKPMN